MPSKNVYVSDADLYLWERVEAMAREQRLSVSHMLLQIISNATETTAEADPYADIRADIDRLGARVKSLEIDVSALATDRAAPW